jgi:hypothetical protein
VLKAYNALELPSSQDAEVSSRESDLRSIRNEFDELQLWANAVGFEPLKYVRGIVKKHSDNVKSMLQMRLFTDMFWVYSKKFNDVKTREELIAKLEDSQRQKEQA